MLWQQPLPSPIIVTREAYEVLRMYHPAYLHSEATQASESKDWLVSIDPSFFDLINKEKHSHETYSQFILRHFRETS